MTTRSIFSRRLSNGLSLQCLDQSKKITAERWYLCVSVRMKIPVERKWFVKFAVDEEKFQRIRRRLGSEVFFEHKTVRNLISVDQKDRVLKDICDNVEETTIKYLGHDDFAAKCILKRYTEQQGHDIDLP